MGDRAFQEGEEGRPEVRVDEDRGLGVQVQPAPAQHLHHLFERADPAGQNDEAIGLLNISRLRSCIVSTRMVGRYGVASSTTASQRCIMWCFMKNRTAMTYIVHP